MSDDVLESEIRGLSARVAAAMCRFLMAVAEYDRRRSWERWECHEMAGWLSWKCGISPVTAREYSRVATALTGLPLVRERFAAGRLSYSQVRAICRSATPATESMLLEWAEVSTAAQLEQITAAYRRSSQAAKEDEARRDRGRFLRFGYDRDGCLVGNFRLTAEAGALLAGAIRAYVEREAVSDAEADGARDPVGAVQADALVELITAGHHAFSSGSLSDEDSRYLVNIITEARVLRGGSPGAEEADGEAGMCHVEDGPGLSDDTLRRVTCDSATVQIVEAPDGSVLDVGRRTRRISRRMRRALRHRDRCCRYPGCLRRAVHGHHIRHWSDGGQTNLRNLVALCNRHHHRVHEGGYQVRALPGERFEFVHPGGWAIPALCPAPDQVHTLVDWDEPLPYRDRWDGSRLDVHMTTACLLEADERASRTPGGGEPRPDSAESAGVGARTG